MRTTASFRTRVDPDRVDSAPGQAVRPVIPARTVSLGTRREFSLSVACSWGPCHVWPAEDPAEAGAGPDRAARARPCRAADVDGPSRLTRSSSPPGPAGRARG